MKFVLYLLITLVTANNIVEPNYNTYAVQEDLVPIIGYHRIVSNDEKITKPSLEMKVRDFEKQIDYFTNELNCNWITMDKLSTYVSNREKVPTNTCLITFDDGTHYEYENALPILDKYKVVATFYVATKRISSKKFYMNWEQIKELSDRGHEIGSHTRDVLSGINTEKLNFKQIEDQITGSKKDLENKGFKCSTFAYPLGEWNEQVIQILKSNNFKLGRAITKYKNKDGTLFGNWRDRRPLTISHYEEKYLWHMHYTKPEVFSVQELAETLKYKGWWQFEEEYLPEITDNDTNQNIQDIKVRSSNVPSIYSYGVVEMPTNGYKISNKFMIAVEGSFTIELIYSGGMTNVVVNVDDKLINQYSSNKYENIGDLYYYSYYVDVDLKPGVHTLSVENKSKNKILLDRFRMFSNINQNFYYTSKYKLPEEPLFSTKIYIYIFAIILPISLATIFLFSVILYYRKRRNIREIQQEEQQVEIRII